MMRHVFVMKSIVAMVWWYGVDEGRFFFGASRNDFERRKEPLFVVDSY